MTHHTPHEPDRIDAAIDVIRQQCPTGRVATTLPLALIEELDERRGTLARSTYLEEVIDAAMTRRHPHLPDVADGKELIDAIASRRYRQHVRSIEIDRAARESSS
ncbi:MAG: hypothetical protein M3065_21940 [Actinomycetota bacterium]|nr:hypothetical protein [Actinomycetota bacterium]